MIMDFGSTDILCLKLIEQIRRITKIYILFRNILVSSDQHSPTEKSVILETGLCNFKKYFYFFYIVFIRIPNPKKAILMLWLQQPLS